MPPSNRPTMHFLTASLSTQVAVLLFILACGGCAQNSPPEKPERTQSAETLPKASPSQQLPAPVIELEPDEQRLALADFLTFPEASDDVATSGWTEEGVIIRGTGTPKGYLYTQKTFENFRLRYDLRFPAALLSSASPLKENTGVLVYITGDQKVWPLSMEVQGKYVDLGSVKENGGAAKATQTFDKELQQKVIGPAHEWNSLEVISQGGALTVLLNGEKITTSEPNFLSSGPIGLQAEGFPVEFANLRILVLP
ncbi:protein of unknown function DUF1080 [Planctopirus limnophila DSM 3776]|uniref:3-keto-alpha-glucoside-1,2-lyase/3-keto-2-hydroxy-glucal hydratase domain-containing protein n=1 Tax=Planctopirus limnophila (strain ATCC 43296 / DSM 3776 / IFAM 1008 / Mu 290) TaxID=521674 RepID=D5SU12_PLAL2|nr:DUF1080 domain-containing protein [Planctopirus limnophila]ADG66997.1 protein of unknown function DUF1080 [Planctopirus limnophila DSM 3776]